jgi:hypothetical protein
MVHGAAAGAFGVAAGEGMDAACAGSGMSANINDALATSTAIRFATTRPPPKKYLKKPYQSLTILPLNFSCEQE